MRIGRCPGRCRLLSSLAALVWVLLPAPAVAQLYRWTDDRGTVHFADDLNSVPEAFRPQMERLTVGPVGGPTSRFVPPGTAEPRAARPLARDERWRGRTFGEWLGEVRDPVPRVRVDALSALAFFGAPAVPALVDGLRDLDGQVRVGAARGLGQVGPAARDAVAPLVDALRDPDARVRFDAAMALGRIGPAARDAIPALGRALRDPASEVRVGAAMGLAGMGPAAQEMTAPLSDALRDGNAALRISAAYALGNIGPAARPAVPALLAALRDSQISVRTSAATALGGIGPPAREAVTELRRLAEGDAGPVVSQTSRNAAVRVAGREREAALRQELRSAAREALKQIESR